MDRDTLFYQGLALQWQEELIIFDKELVVYTEGQEDISFWTSLFERYAPHKKIFFVWNTNDATTNEEAVAGVGQCLKYKVSNINVRFLQNIASIAINCQVKARI